MQSNSNRKSEGWSWLWKVSYYEKLSPYFIGFLVVWTLITLHNSVELSTKISTSREDPYSVSTLVVRQKKDVLSDTSTNQAKSRHSAVQ